MMLEIAGGAVAVLFTGGVGWWARNVTSGAAKGQFAYREVEAMKKSIEDHERREEQKFDHVGDQVEGLQGQVRELLGSVGELHGKVDSLSTFIRNGGSR